MNTIGNYGMYQKSLYGSDAQKNKAGKAESGGRAEKSKGQKNVQLSDKAMALLKELQKNYKNMDFMVADYETEEEASEYLARGTREYSVLIDPEELEKMAADEEYKKKNLSLLGEATGKLDELKGKLQEEGKGQEVKHLGVTIGADGTVSYFAELEKMGEKQMERIEKGREAKRQEKAEAVKAERRSDPYQKQENAGKRARVTAGTAEELLDKIRGFDWNKVKKEEEKISGSRFDLTI